MAFVIRRAAGGEMRSGGTWASKGERRGGPEPAPARDAVGPGPAPDRIPPERGSFRPEARERTIGTGVSRRPS